MMDWLDDESGLLGMTHKPGPVIYIGRQAARIVEVTRHFLEYIDEAGESWIIDLHECNYNWSQYFEQHRSEFVTFPEVTQEEVNEENATMVAMRGTRYVQFFDDRRTRFEFASDAERWKLQGALLNVGWRTFDME